jgi:putative endonuclease
VKEAHRPHELGKRGEDLAARYMVEKHGLVLLCRNWSCRTGELDMVLTDGVQVVIVEVKTRAGTDFGAGAEAVDEEKARRVRATGNVFLSRFRIPGWVPTRYDVVSILWPPAGRPRIQHYEDVF